MNLSTERSMPTYSVGLLVVPVLAQARAGVLAQGLTAMAGSRNKKAI